MHGKKTKKPASFRALEIELALMYSEFVAFGAGCETKQCMSNFN